MPSPVRPEHKGRSGFPARRRRLQVMERGVLLLAGLLRPQSIIAVSLVDEHGIRHFHDAFLDALQFVTRTGQEQQEKKIHHRAQRNLGLSDAHGFDDDRVKPSRLTEQHCFARSSRDAAGTVTGRRRPNKGLRLAAEALHPGLVAKNAAPGKLAGRINGQHRHFMALLHQ